MKNIKVLVVEDSALAAEAISITLGKHSLEVVQICDTGEAAIEFLKNNEVDLVLMDIMLAGAMDGISTAQMMRQHRMVPIIYLTDHVDEKSIDRAKKTFPANYLSKPYGEADLVRAIDFALSNALEDEKQQTVIAKRDDVFIRTDSQQFMKVLYKDVLFLEAARSYCKVVTDNNTYTICTSMNLVHEKFKNPDFVRVHRSYVVNTRRITRLDGNVIFLGDKEVDMGKEFREDLLNTLNLIK